MKCNLTGEGEPYGVSKIAEPFGDSPGSMVTAFINAYYRNTGVPVIGIPAGINGSSIYVSWQEGQKGIENAKDKYQKTYQWLQENGFKVRHSYMVWDQGEADVEKVDDYENALRNTIVEMQNVGIERCFMIQIGGIHLYTGYEEKYKERYELYQNMIQEQRKICENNDWVTLVSTNASVLTKCSKMMTDMVHLNQEALDIIGSEAGKKVASYADQAREKTLTQEQSDALINFAKRFSQEGFEKRLLVYGINAKARAYNLQLVNYEKPYVTLANGVKLSLINFGAYGKEYGWNGEKTEEEFVPSNYIGLDCSGYISFLYHYVFDLPFNYWYNNMNVPWSTEQYVENRKMDTYDGTKQVETFKIVYEQHRKEQKYSLNDLASLTDLQPGDLLIGRGGKEEGDNTNHIVLYAGKDKNGMNKIIHSTGNPGLYNMYEDDENGKKIYYYMGEADLANSEFKYRNVYVLRLNDDIISKDYTANDKPIDWGALSTQHVYKDILPKATLKYSTSEATRNSVTVTIEVDKKIQKIEGWTLSADKLKLTKEYHQNANEEITIKDLVGNEVKVNVEITNILEVKRGDINNDEKIDTADLLKLLRHIEASKNEEIRQKNPTWLLTEFSLQAGDINKDEKIDTTDVLEILKHIVANKNQEIDNKYPNSISGKVSLLGDKNEVKRGETITILVKATEVKEGKGITLYNALLEYDNNVFDCKVSGDDEGNWTRQGEIIEKSLTMSRSDLLPNSDDQIIAKIVLTAKTNARIGKHSFKLKNIEFTTEEEAFFVDEVETNISIKDDNTLNNTQNNTNMAVNTNNNGNDKIRRNTQAMGINSRGDSSTVNKEIPKAGITRALMIGTIIGIVAAIVFYIKYKKAY